MTQYEIVFDEEFLGGMTLRCSPNQAYRLPPSCIVNISYGKRLESQKEASKTARHAGNYTNPHTSYSNALQSAHLPPGHTHHGHHGYDQMGYYGGPHMHMWGPPPYETRSMEYVTETSRQPRFSQTGGQFRSSRQPKSREWERPPEERGRERGRGKEKGGGVTPRTILPRGETRYISICVVYLFLPNQGILSNTSSQNFHNFFTFTMEF